MKTKNIFRVALGAALLASTTSCSDALEEYNPGGGTMEQYAATESGYRAIVNQIYFAMARYFYGTADATGSWGKPQMLAGGYMAMSEAETDLWTSVGDFPDKQAHYFYFNQGASNTTFTAGFWNCAYDGIGGCNTAIDLNKFAPLSPEEKNSCLAEARMMRGVYYFNIVEFFGGVVKITDTKAENITYSPERTDPLTIYKEVIIPDLKFAADNLAVGDDKTTTMPTRKAAIGFLAKAYLQVTRWCPESEKEGYYDAAYKTAKLLIDDCESGGHLYNTYLYEQLKDVFAEANNWENKEALWKQRWAVEGKSQSGSTGLANLNRNDEHFMAWVSHFGARKYVAEEHETWAGSKEGDFMPTQHLLNLYVQADGTLDPRFHQWFTTEWPCNNDYTWTATDCQIYGKDASMKDKQINVGDMGIKIVMPQDADYAAEVAAAPTSNYLLVDYKKLYSDTDRDVIQMVNGNENQLRYFYPSLNKHNSSTYIVENFAKDRLGNLNATFIMRTPEVYLIAAEAALHINKAGEALGFVNKIRHRAGANDLQAVTVDDVLDERGRELCGEYNRWFDLARLHKLDTKDYLQQTHPNLAKYWFAGCNLKPIPQAYVDLVENGSIFVNPGY